jgi:hypothetical protein
MITENVDKDKKDFTKIYKDDTPYNENTPYVKELLLVGLKSGKLSEATYNNYMSIDFKSDDRFNWLVKLMVLTPINKTLLDPDYPNALINLCADNSYDEISKKYDCDLREIKKAAPYLYKAKFFEKFRRLPGDLIK